MTIRDMVRDYVLADGTVAASLGTRLYPDMLPEKVTFPAGVILAVDILRPNTLRTVASLGRARVQIDIYAQPQTNPPRGSRSVADDLGNAIRRRLDGFSGALEDTSTSPASPVRAWVTFDLETEGAEPEIHGGLSRHTADYLVEFQTAGGYY
jgi:hypothetical protein